MGRVLAFLQARMGSTRLPGKVLLKIQGQSILIRAIGRLRAAQVLDGVVVLTTRLDEDDQVADEALRAGADVYRGPTLDVLTRFREASEAFAPEVIVRATADNPLIDIGSVDRVVCALRANRMDWCIEGDLPLGAATEALTAAALEEVDRKAIEFRHREHVTLYIKEHPEEFRTAILRPPDALRRPDVRLTVDTAEDFGYIESLVRRVPEEQYPIALERYLSLVVEPSLRDAVLG